jgi:ABC-type bacteriocin/lantibiotic exporter with double-glycine peptidase domain
MGRKIRLTESELTQFLKKIITEVESSKPRLLNVPHFLQSDDSTCGPASLRMVFAYYGVDLPEHTIAKACKHTYEYGCQGEDMVCAAEHFGFDVYLKNNSTIAEIERLVNNGVPVIVDWFCGDPPEGHSSVVIGVSDTDVYILDPYLEEMRVVSRYDFRRCWFDFRETPITPENLYVGQIIVLRPKK